MCCLKLSKNIIPFAITFSVGLLLAGLFSGMFSCFNSSSSVETKQLKEVNEVRIYSPMHENKSMCNMKENSFKTDDSKVNVLPYRSERRTRIVKPTFDETIIINSEVE